MAWGISPRKVAVIPLGGYNADHYLTLLYCAFENLGWRISYFNHDGIIGYTGISLQSYAEEVSVRIINNYTVIKSECVGYQFFFTDYGKNEKNIELLLGEIEYVEYHLQHTLEETTQQLMDSVPENQFINLSDPPMGAKEKLVNFSSAFTPQKGYWITPLLVILNIAVYIVTVVAMIVALVLFAKHQTGTLPDLRKLYLAVGFSSRTQVLNGEVWRLITNIFMHFSIMHLVGNMIVLIYIGSMIESKLGKWNYLLLYIFTGICASMASVMWHENSIGGGASGAIFGLFGILLALLSTDFYENNARRALLISTGIFLALNIIPVGREIDHAAHIGGLTAGYIMGLASYWGLKHKKQKFSIIVSLALTIVFTTACISFAPRYDFNTADKLINQIPEVLDSLNNDFYGNDRNLPDSARLLKLQHEAFPRIKKLKDIAQQLEKVPLPKKQHQTFSIRSKMASQEALIFELLYKEVRDKDQHKYRKAINDATERLNQLRTDWGDTQRQGN